MHSLLALDCGDGLTVTVAELNLSVKIRVVVSKETHCL